MTRRVAVVGHGVAGLAAALAARGEGAEVTLYRGAAGGSALAGGAWDLSIDPAPSPALDGRSVADVLDALRRARPDHPLARRSTEAAWAALAASHAALVPALGSHVGPASWVGVDASHAPASPSLVATSAGLLRPTTLVQRAVLDLATRRAGVVAVASLPGLRGFDARFLAASLNEHALRLGHAWRFSAVDVEMFRRAHDELALPHELAEILGSDDAIARASTALERALGGVAFDAILVPPVLGLAPDDRVRAALERALGLPIGEVVEPLSPAQSVRTMRALDAAIAAAGCVVRPRAARVDPRTSTVVGLDGAAERVDAIVLATGKFLGGGLVQGADVAVEPLAGLPVPSCPPSSLAALGLGVRTDEALRPVDASGAPISPSLHACGALLDGVGPADGLSVATATGWLAGQGAARAT